MTVESVVPDKQAENQNRMVEEFLREIERRERELPAAPARAKTASRIQYRDPRMHFMTSRAPNLSVAEREKTLGAQRQATRYPVYKNVSQLWSFDFKKAEQLRLKATLLWQPPSFPLDIDAYFKRVCKRWPQKTTGMSEEIALKHLMDHGYDVAKALAALEATTMKQHFEVVGLINQMNRAEPRQEVIGFLVRQEESYYL